MFWNNKRNSTPGEDVVWELCKIPDIIFLMMAYLGAAFNIFFLRFPNIRPQIEEYP